MVVMTQTPLPAPVAAKGLAGCVRRTGVLLARHRVRLPRGLVGMRLQFADGTSSWVYRETIIEGAAPQDPCVLVVAFRLRLVRGWAHPAFRWVSLLNTPLFVGFPGFVSKLWLAHDQRGTYRGLYEWDGPIQAMSYSRALWRVLALVSVPGSIGYQVLPDLRRDQLLANPELFGPVGPSGPGQSLRLTEVS